MSFPIRKQSSSWLDSYDWWLFPNTYTTNEKNIFQPVFYTDIESRSTTDIEHNLHSKTTPNTKRDHCIQPKSHNNTMINLPDQNTNKYCTNLMSVIGFNGDTHHLLALHSSYMFFSCNNILVRRNISYKSSTHSVDSKVFPTESKYYKSSTDTISVLSVSHDGTLLIAGGQQKVSL